ncbi:OLC1v1037572C1 [Oldenlandia corymbosa var. corymbosa]|uniref:OLC1v1037572C1 n=1 Tax=Oldenlandia corymbosa var. corymbosa TaxID=529605 RepID=A0AAV1CZ58_OLDCO|nr:OLC1v1037572C1 [Oldenlandia corymbosa var. corymbosa]
MWLFSGNVSYRCSLGTDKPSSSESALQLLDVVLGMTSTLPPPPHYAAAASTARPPIPTGSLRRVRNWSGRWKRWMNLHGGRRSGEMNVFWSISILGWGQSFFLGEKIKNKKTDSKISCFRSNEFS